MSLAASIVSLAVFVLLAHYVVRLMLDSVSHTREIPGPLWSRLTNLWYLRQMIKGDFHNTNIKLHRQKGKMNLQEPLPTDPRAMLHSLVDVAKAGIRNDSSNCSELL